jgi:4-carboxymuconolactone decarboxylase
VARAAVVLCSIPVEEPGHVLRKLAIGDDALLHRALAGERGDAVDWLDPKTHALVSVAALIAVDACEASYLPAVEAAREAGATDEEVVACLFAALPMLGAARVVSAAPKLGLALGYDVAAALEDASSLAG